MKLTLVVQIFNKKSTILQATNEAKQLKIDKEINCEFTNQDFEFEVASKLSKRGYKIGEVPVFYKPRYHKEGKRIKAIVMFFKYLQDGDVLERHSFKRLVKDEEITVYRYRGFWKCMDTYKYI